MATVSLLPVPPEIIHEIFRHLSLSSDCASCLQTDLAALCVSSKILNTIATPYLYSSINLATLHDSSTYERRLHSIFHTLSSAPKLGAHVKYLQLSHSEDATEGLWAKIAVCTPNLKVIQGVETFFATDPEGPTAEAVAALQGLNSLQKLVLHREELPVQLSQLLGSWPELQTLVLGDIIADNSSFSDFSALGGGKLQELYLHDFDLDFTSSGERDDALATIPPLETLGINYSLGFSLSGVLRFLQQSAVHAERLRTLEFCQQLRHENPAAAVAEVLKEAVGLKKLVLSMKRYTSDPIGEMPDEGLASKSLEDLIWVGMYTSPEATAAGSDEFVHLLVSSLHQLPALRRLVVGCEVSGCESAEEAGMFSPLCAECDREGSVLTEDPEEIGRHGKRVLLVLDEAPVCKSEWVAEMKHGVAAAEGAPVCAVVVTDEKEDDECEFWDRN